jgi:hypothetical protein
LPVAEIESASRAEAATIEPFVPEPDFTEERDAHSRRDRAIQGQDVP